MENKLFLIIECISIITVILLCIYIYHIKNPNTVITTKFDNIIDSSLISNIQNIETPLIQVSNNRIEYLEIGERYEYYEKKQDIKNPFEKREVHKILVVDKKDGYVKYTYDDVKFDKEYSVSTKENLILNKINRK